MRKIFYLLGHLTIFNLGVNAQRLTLWGSSNVTIFIEDSSEQNFLDTVEAKLLRTITLMQKGEKATILNAYSINPLDGTDWAIRLSQQEIKEFTSVHPPSYIATNYQYELIINWDSTLNTGNILGFSKKYYCPLYVTDYRSHKNICVGIYNKAIWHIPLAKYRAFLNQNEILKLYGIIRKHLICFVDDDTVRTANNDTSSLSYQTLVFNKSTDSLIQMPLSLWARLFQNWSMGGDISCYDNAYCAIDNRLTKTEVKDIFYRKDTLRDEEDHLVTVENECHPISITVGEYWKFDTVSYNPNSYVYPYGMKVTREIKSIGANIGNAYEKPKRTWMSYKDLNSLCSPRISQIVKEQLDNALFNKLTLKFQYPGY